MAAPQQSPRQTETRNSKAHRDFFIDERFEAGIQLRGTEIKSIRAGQAQISDAFGRFEKDELWLHNAHIEPYAFASLDNHSVRRPRKLLLHRHQIRKIAQAMQTGGRTLVPLRIYFKGSLAKVELGLGAGKKLFDKRDDLKKKAEMREVKKAFKFRRG
jgi:SsrA-binding protein